MLWGAGRQPRTIKESFAFIGTAMLWGAVGFMALLGLVIFMARSRDLMRAGMDPVILWFFGGLLLVTAVIFTPPVFSRAARLTRMAGFVGLVAAIIFSSVLQSKWQETPEGGAELQREVAQTQIQAIRRMDAERELAEAAKLQVQLDSMVADQRALRRCGGAFSAAVKSALHNPRSFEHVNTEFGTGSRNASLTFRAENGFGAIRTATVEALLDPNTCEIIAIDEPQTR